MEAVKAGNEELAGWIQAGRDRTENMLALYQNLEGMIYSLAIRYSSYMEMDDLIQEAYIALCRAVERYRPGTCMFSTYAYSCIQRHMLRCVQKGSGFSAGMWQYIGEYRRLRAVFKMECNKEPHAGEVSYYLRIGRPLALEVMKTAKMARKVSLDSPLVNGDEEMVLSDTLAGDVDVESEVLENVYQGQQEEILWAAVDGLPGQQPDMIRKRYLDGMTLKEISADCSITAGKVRTGIEKGLRALKYSRMLQPFRDEYIESAAMHGNGVERFQCTWTSSTERVALELTEKFQR